jgi:hypothetical protein
MTFLLRGSLALALAFAAVGFAAAADAGAASASAAGTAAPSVASASAAAPAPGKVVNTICPVEGDPVDPSIAPTTVVTKDGRTVVIGTCCAKCAAVITKDPDKYADAALKNEKAK